MANNEQLNAGNTPIIVPFGGTGVATNTAYAVLCGGTTTTGAIQSIASVGTARQVFRSNGAAALPSMDNASWQLIQSASPSSAASVEFLNLSADFIAYRFFLEYVIPATDGVNLMLQVSTDNGSTWVTAAGSYTYRNSYNSGGAFTNNSTTATGILYGISTGNATNEGVWGVITLYNPIFSARLTTTEALLANMNSTGVLEQTYATGYRNVAEENDACRLLFSSGNIADGEIRLYGLVLQ